MNYNVIVTRNCEVISRFTTPVFKDAVKEFKRIARNAWRRKSAFNQVEFDTLKMFWNETPKKGDRIPYSGFHRFYCNIEQWENL